VDKIYTENCGGGQGLSWAVEPRKEEERRRRRRRRRKYY
jgi:hypothetical protein